MSRQTASMAVSQVVSGSNEGLLREGTERRRSKSAPMTLADRVKSRVRVVRTGKTSGPGWYLYLHVFEVTVFVLTVELKILDHPEYLKDLAGIPQSSSDEEENEERLSLRSQSASPVRVRRGQSYNDEKDLKCKFT